MERPDDQGKQDESPLANLKLAVGQHRSYMEEEQELARIKREMAINQSRAIKRSINPRYRRRG